MPRLAGKVALITGAGTGIGRATAKAMATEGARVVIAELNNAAGEQVAQVIAQAGGECIAVRTDVTDEVSMKAAIDMALSHYGALHVLHNNAGGSTILDTYAEAGGNAIDTAVNHYGALHILHNNAGGSTSIDNTVVEAPIAEFWRVIKLDLFGTFLGCRFGIPALIQSGGGSVINMSSNVALMGIPGRDCYTAAKGAVAAITRSMAVEFAPQKVRVNAIAPSATMTDRVRALVAGNAGLTKLADSHLVGLIEPEDIANMAVFLASDESRMVTGHVYPVDSGVTIS